MRQVSRRLAPWLAFAGPLVATLLAVSPGVARADPSFHLWPAGDRPEYHAIALLEPLAGRNRALPVVIAGSEWRLRFVAPHEGRGPAVPLVLLIGAAASLLLFLTMQTRLASLDRGQETTARLRASERRYRQLFEDSPLPTWVYDPQTLAFLDVNGAAVRQYGWSREEFLSMTLLDIRRPEDVAALLAGITATPVAPAHPVRHRRKDGTDILVEITVQDFLLDERATRLVVGLDVTDRERILAERQKLETRFARLSESGLLGVTLADAASGTFIDANDTFLRLVGYSREDLESGRLGWEMLTSPETRRVNVAIAAQMALRGFAGPIEKEYLRKDGTRAQALVGTAMADEGKVIAFILDISERKRLEKLEREAHELEAQNRRFQEASRLKSEFLANMSHELRTPLNAILGFTQLVHDGEAGEVSAEQRECLANVLVSSRHLLQLINDVLDLAKVEAGKLEFRPGEVRLGAVVAEVIATLRAQLDAKGLRVREEVAAELGPVVTDELRLKQVLYNYVSNAIKFSPAGAEIGVAARPEGDRAFRVEVEDRGIGIKAGDLGRLFVDFQQLDSSSAKRHAGTGLGLALTRRLVEAQGGQVGVTSEYGRGSVFHAVLPRRPEVRCPATAS